MAGYGQGIIIRDDRTGNNASVDPQGALRISGDVNASFSAASIAINDGGTPSQKATVFNTGAIRISGDVRLAGASTGDGAILDGVDSNIKATVYTGGAIRVSGDVKLTGASTGDGAILDGVDSNIKVTIKDYANSNPLTVALVNSSGDVYNGNEVSLKASTNNIGDVDILTLPSDIDIRDLTVADKITIGNITVPVGVSGDISTIPKAGQVWPVNDNSGSLTIDGSVSVSSLPSVTIGLLTAPVDISGDVSTTPKAGQTWPVSISSTVNSQIVGGISSTVGISGDAGVELIDSGGTNRASIYNTGAIRISGDVKLVGSAGGDGSILDGVDSNIKATVYTGGAIRISGDVKLAGASTGDGAILDGVSSSIKATVFSSNNALRISGDVVETITPFPVVTGGQVTASGDNTLISSPGGSNKLRLWYVASANTHSTRDYKVAWKEGAGGGQRYVSFLPSAGGIFAHSMRRGWVFPENTALVLNASGDVVGGPQIEWTVEYDVL